MTAAKAQTKVEEMIEVLRQWQGIERHAINEMAEIQEETPNALIRLIMEIIRHDSLMHHRTQQFLIDSVTQGDVALTREDVAQIWDRIVEHDKVEKKTIDLAKKLRAKAWSPVHKLLLDYLLTDEAKHDTLLEHLETLKTGMSRASGG